jgi:GntR family transcriptional regulator
MFIICPHFLIVFYNLAKTLDKIVKVFYTTNCISCINTVLNSEERRHTMILDHKDRRPMYEQVIDHFRQMILCGAMEPDSPMPSVRSLAMELSINPNTIQRAYQELERMGYIYTIKAKGSYVSEQAAKEDNRRREILSELQPVVEKAYKTGFADNDIREMLEQCIKVHHNEQGGGL